jgi:hypothetical protein
MIAITHAKIGLKMKKFATGHLFAKRRNLPAA